DDFPLGCFRIHRRKIDPLKEPSIGVRKEIGEVSEFAHRGGLLRPILQNVLDVLARGEALEEAVNRTGRLLSSVCPGICT
ncbi:MAG: hypothetical protein QOF51_3871, partial [Chloroflexota bacterium]|nr:hypothetical protein [Chloroflexota bacterium]